MMKINKTFLEKPPLKWDRTGDVLEKGAKGEFDCDVIGDPCIVWDENYSCLHMFYFAQRKADNREINSNAHAICKDTSNIRDRCWEKLGPLEYENPGALFGDTHKPWIIMDAYRPNVAAVINGMYWLLSTTFKGINKVIQIASSNSLNGPWKLQEEPILDIGKENSIDGYHLDAPTGFWFKEKKEILIYYMAYPKAHQNSYIRSPYGSSSAAAILKPGEVKADKMFVVLPPSNEPGHWTQGYIGGLQLIKAKDKGWYALINASPTPPASIEQEPDMREPASSLGGWAYTHEEWPVNGWRALDKPIECIEDIPEEAKSNGEGYNLWRHHLVVMPSGDLYCFYNSGYYGQEKLFGKFVDCSSSNIVFRSISDDE